MYMIPFLILWCDILSYKNRRNVFFIAKNGACFSWEDVTKRDEVLRKIQAAAVAKDQRTQEAWARLHERARTAAAETSSASDY